MGKCKLKEKYNNLQKEHQKLKEELEFTRKYIHDNSLEWDLLSKYTQYCEQKTEYSE
jgi:hypothetical protein